MSHHQDWSFLGVSVTYLVAGALGGLVRGFNRPDQSWRRRAAAAAVGAVLAGYGTPVAAPLAGYFLGGFGVTADAAAGLAGFLLGLTGLSLCDGAIRLARRWRDNPTLPPLWRK